MKSYLARFPRFQTLDVLAPAIEPAKLLCLSSSAVTESIELRALHGDFAIRRRRAQSNGWERAREAIRLHIDTYADADVLIGRLRVVRCVVNMLVFSSSAADVLARRWNSDAFAASANLLPRREPCRL